MSEVIPGGWTEYSCKISEEAMAAFKEAFAHFVGANYSPVACASQVVNGVNYSFFCNMQLVIPNAPNEAAMVEIHVPPNGKPTIVGIHRVPR